MASQYLQINFYYFSLSLSIRFPLRIKCSLSVLLTCPVRYCSIINYINSHKKISKDTCLYLAKCKIVNKKIIINENRKIILYKQFNTLNDDEYRWTYNSKEKKIYLNLLRYLFQIIFSD